MSPFTIIGHRGACAHEPENTLSSVHRAIADGADMVEVDVRWADSEIVVIHDDTLDRTTSGTGSIYDISFNQLRELDAGNGEKIPTLAEVLALTLPTLPLNIEIKDTAATAAICELLQNEPELDFEKIVISSFHEKATREARAELPEIPIGILAHDQPAAIAPMFALAAELGAVSVHPHVSATSSELVGLAHAADYRVLPYTVRTAAQLHHLLDCRADGCFADDPKLAAQIASSRT
jgi:glycerophosphoryl diester phosphodiesterase